MGQGKDVVDASPAEIRMAIAKARSEFSAHLCALDLFNLLGVGDSPGNDHMPTMKKRPASKASKSAAGSKDSMTAHSKDEAKKLASGAKLEHKNPESKAKVEPKKSDAKVKASKSRTPPDRIETRKRAAKSPGIAAKAGAALDTLAAGAVVGAVKSAAHAIDENPVEGFRGRGKGSSSTSAVLGELAPDAALGAVVGAAQAVLPVEEKPKRKGVRPRKR